MIRWLNKQGVSSSEGFILQRMHRFYYHYIENDHVMKINVEPLRHDDQYYENIYANSLEHWLPPHDEEIISSEKKMSIKKNIEAALEFMKIEYIWE